jgi:hypothetical protein
LFPEGKQKINKREPKGKQKKGRAVCVSLSCKDFKSIGNKRETMQAVKIEDFKSA